MANNLMPPLPDGLEEEDEVQRERKFLIDNLLVQIYVIIEMIWWTGLAPWEFEFPFPGSLISTFLGGWETT